jgi:hypothetical protein
MKRLLIALLIMSMNVNVLKARPPISPKRVKKELLDMFAVAASPSDINDNTEGYIKFVTADKQIKYLTVQVNDMYGYMRYLDRLKLISPLEFDKKKAHLTVMQENAMRRCYEDYSYMEENGLDCFVHHSRRIASVCAFNDRLRDR